MNIFVSIATWFFFTLKKVRHTRKRAAYFVIEFVFGHNTFYAFKFGACEALKENA